jgi:hypothetical protein
MRWLTQGLTQKLAKVMTAVATLKHLIWITHCNEPPANQQLKLLDCFEVKFLGCIDVGVITGFKGW